MARKARIEFPGALYHVIVRGNQKQFIFISDDDYQQYLSILAAYKERYRFTLLAYVLMHNHIHLLILSGKTPLSKIMQGINQSYTMYFNSKYGMVGHLFQGRYKAILCDRDKYLLNLIKYIHLNPVRAARAAWPDEYKWSSHRAYLYGHDELEAIDTAPVLQMFSEKLSAATRLYRDYMGSEITISKDDVYRVTVQAILGDDRFVEQVNMNRPIAVSKKRKKEYSLTQIAKSIERLYGISLAQLRSGSKSKDISNGKRLLSLVALEYGYKGIEIATYLQKDPVIVSRHKKESVGLENEIHRVITALKNA